ncbi:MAG: hypothetical protein SFX18_04950 [Pirellulales bacterium]|nr:hypothetical protein [Pirellulales bacterium]
MNCKFPAFQLRYSHSATGGFGGWGKQVKPSGAYYTRGFYTPLAMIRLRMVDRGEHIGPDEYRG